MNVIIVGCGAMGGAVLSGCLEKGIWKRREVKILSKTDELHRYSDIPVWKGVDE